MKLSSLAIAILGASLLPSAAIAQAASAPATAPALTTGTVVYDPQGSEVGKIESVSGETIVLDTGTAKATLPKSAFGAGAKGPSINATKAQVEQLVAASVAKADESFSAALVPGAEVRGKSGALVGTIKEVTGEQIVIDRPTGPVSLPKKAFAMGPSGLTISLTVEELDAAAKAATPQA